MSDPYVERLSRSEIRLWEIAADEQIEQSEIPLCRGRCRLAIVAYADASDAVDAVFYAVWRDIS